ncbi:Double-strand break repair protein MRE11 [Vitis vinifera]|uniref:DNA-directed RNA polymerase subunit n=1 Tax=Vitis vinifera TaxID=29760 RepID=A0A438HPS6_VITVI|nr:Double-strand break repair protein MRE11 [Vitis vinifera]
MFFLSLIEHTLQLRPHLLDLPLNEAVKGEFESFFLDKVIVNLGLCISVYDMRSIDCGFVFPRDGASILNVKFAKIDDFERLRPEELNQQNIEALVAENNLILPVNDVDLALHNFVNKDDKMSFYSCVQYNLEETHERVKERSVHSKETPQFMSGAQSLENITSKGTAETGSAVSFSDDEDLSQLSGSKSTTKGRSSSSATFKYSHDASEHGKDVQLREMSSFALGRLA